MSCEDRLRAVLAALDRDDYWSTELRHAVRDAEAYLAQAEAVVSEELPGVFEEQVDVQPEVARPEVAEEASGQPERECPVPGCGLPSKMCPSGWVCPRGHGFWGRGF